jgi:hypothetical protein
MRGLRKTLAAGMITSSFALAASAQVSIYRWNVPDFDQKRAALALDGGMFCVPTSAVNWMGYISNHGFPPMMGGPQNWQSIGQYSLVSSNIASMGSLMNTSPSDGTTGLNGINGLRGYLFTRAPFLFTASHWYGNVTPFDVQLQMASNGLVNLCYGYYDLVSSPGAAVYLRNGGHCVTLNGIEDAFSSSPVFRIRDPADDSALFTQSTFATKTTRAIPQTFDNSILPGGFITRTRLLDFGVGSTTRRYLDSMYVIRASFNCWAPVTTTPEIKVTKVVSLFGDPQPQEVTINLSPGAVANAIALHPDLTKAVVVECTQGATAPIYRKKLINLGTGSSTDIGLLLPALPGKTPITFDRFGRLIECDGSVLKLWELSGLTPALISVRTLASPASSVCFDDALSEVIVLTPSNRRLIRLSPDLVSSAIDEPLPTSVPAIGDGSVVPDPATGKYIIAISGSPSLHQLGLIPGTPRLALENSLLLPAVLSIQDIQPADGGGFFAMCDGRVKVIDRDPANARLRLSPVQIFNTLPPMRTMSLSRSRTNFEQALHTGPAWANIVNPNEGVTSVPDCIADYNLSNSVTVQDVFDFVSDWFTNNPHADVNGSASLTVQDVFDFLDAWFRGC